LSEFLRERIPGRHIDAGHSDQNDVVDTEQGVLLA
jgi:hypothetical protein